VNAAGVPHLQDRPPAALTLSVPRSTATFRTEARQFFKPMRRFEEDLHGIFELNTIQRQSADWASRGFGINPLNLAKGIQRACGGTTRLRRPASRSRRTLSSFASTHSAPVARVFGPAIPTGQPRSIGV
jgi:hypothetical protein